jgi:predicted HicB family RNase H-like nuclease
MDILTYHGFEGTAELDMSCRMCRGKLLFMDDLVTYKADTPSGLQHAFEAAVEDYLATCARLGKEPQRPFRGQFNVRIPSSLHRAAALRAVTEGVSLNDLVKQALDLFLGRGEPGQPAIRKTSATTRGSSARPTVQDRLSGTAVPPELHPR